ncbi:GDP-mannose-dependent alpha-(1-6)-phosphatidylinositol monomannoside mannosyltransferase [Gemmata obscuriglobus]|uniref:Glycosyltransferase family 4 protein n=1 Tax=Gemmata obscuriglobus TaxID=114 RepID=A0A2Z3GYX7_9BACT|nr:glycosyltransferase [Gemmata obscuriglobus]AWM36687.1 glycosyltransferase family 4 protein [Gemmata obscuriglobus]QEG30670.1 GDP-mannose-dependent alpha-(1-6)-phosphatidylinositol monomannoside mannosyltransferase [Gemmata obscuriglobus]VTS09997.1 glycosyl transferase family 1 : Glycosyltransferase OS=Singulisphaera acidiphila (strain ATCC BAA-1392 / DSM 18658 / VKM B-2454 / MOB10) GN=Sinac_1453 PE=4 SV=1: Glycos_transf_1 [Gemmata obscuriglobus UQM 2246]
MDAGRPERVVLVHDWLTGTRGGEKCLEPLCRRWPDARLLTLIHKKGTVPAAVEAARIHPSFLNALPKVERYYRYLLPLMPFAAGWGVTDADLVVSLSHAVAKSAKPPKGVPHVCYCFTPMRYAWHMKDAYFRPHGFIGKWKARAVDTLLGRIREWDRRTADRVTHFVAISNTVRDRIRDCYGRDADVIYPPVDTEFYTPAPVPREDFYLVVSALAPYKRFDLAIEACEKLGKKLVVIGSGQHLAKLKASAGPHVQFLGWQPDEVIRDHLRRAKALLFPGEEDFGIVPLEAQACGCPVIGFARGGLTETVRPLGAAAEPTGVFFSEQNCDSVCEAVERFDNSSDHFDPRAARRQAVLFRKERFEAELFTYLDTVLYGRPVEPRKAA